MQKEKETANKLQEHFGRAVYIDLEWNCWDSAKRTTQHREIIEIGAVEVNLETLELTLEKDYLVRPHPFDISDRCTAITGLTAADLKGARSFPEVLAQFEQDFSLRRRCAAPGGTTANSWPKPVVDTNYAHLYGTASMWHSCFGVTSFSDRSPVCGPRWTRSESSSTGLLILHWRTPETRLGCMRP